MRKEFWKSNLTDVGETKKHYREHLVSNKINKKRHGAREVRAKTKREPPKKRCLERSHVANKDQMPHHWSPVYKPNWRMGGNDEVA